VWQWLHNGVTLADSGEKVGRELIDRIATEEIARLGDDPGAYDEARALFMEVAVADDFADFLTLPAYERMP
jgi:malate synthase